MRGCFAYPSAAIADLAAIMADPDSNSRLSPHLPSSSVKRSPHLAHSSLLRSRSRRQASSNGGPYLVPSPSHPLESGSDSQRSSREGSVSAIGEAGAGAFGQFLGDSWNQSLASIQGLANTLLAAGGEQLGAIGRRPHVAKQTSGIKSNRWGWDRHGNSSTHNTPAAWGPAPPPPHRPGIDDVAAGSSTEREAAFRAARMASVLESHEGVNGGLDITGKYKRRNSNETVPETLQPEQYLVYIHRVQPTDTYAGLILRYRCRGDKFKKANGLWSNDSIQMRKWLAFPVDACELRGRPCDAPSGNGPSPKADSRPTTPPVYQRSSNQMEATNHVSPFAQPDSESGNRDVPWTHVKWVQIDSFPGPVEVGRVARQAMGYFPPPRRKSVTTGSSVGTPRQSLDTAGSFPGPLAQPLSRRQSSLGDQPRPLGSPAPSRSRAASDAVDLKPAWMRGPGGVGSMGRNVRAPGPDKDYLNTWAKKHIPSLNIDGLPSMSVMGSETAHLGFTHNSAGIVESPFQEGRDASLEVNQGNGLDKAAAAVENWLRGALSMRPNTPLVGSIRGRAMTDINEAGGDLIELSDTPGEDGRTPHPMTWMESGSGHDSYGDSNQRARNVSETYKGSREDD